MIAAARALPAQSLNRIMIQIERQESSLSSEFPKLNYKENNKNKVPLVTQEKGPEKEPETGYFKYTLGFLGKRGVAFYHTPCLLPEGKGIYVKDIDAFSLVRCRKRKTCLKLKRGFPNRSKSGSIYCCLPQQVLQASD